MALPVQQLTEHVFDYAESVIDWAKARHCKYDLVHSPYWLSGWAGLLVKRVLGIPLANSFHTLGRVKDATRRSDEPATSLVRIAAEHEVIAGSDCVIGSTPLEADDLLEHYGADPTRLCVSPPGVNHLAFSPGDFRSARAEIGLRNVPTVLFVGGSKPSKGVDVAIEAFRLVIDHVPDAQLVILGGPSGPKGAEESEAMRRAADDLNVVFVTAQPHETLASYYRSADVLLFPSRSASFGLVAVEAQACGTPVVAAEVGGLTYAVSDDVSGYLVEGWDPATYAEHVTAILTDPQLADRPLGPERSSSRMRSLGTPQPIAYWSYMRASPIESLLRSVINQWIDDPDLSVEYAEMVEGKWAVRMAQETRDFTTVWFTRTSEPFDMKRMFCRHRARTSRTSIGNVCSGSKLVAGSLHSEARWRHLPRRPNRQRTGIRFRVGIRDCRNLSAHRIVVQTPC